MANSFLTPKVFASTMLVLLKNNLVLGKKVNKEFKDEFKQKGNTISVKRPPEFIVTRGPNIAPQDIVEGETQVVIDTQSHVDVSVTSVDDTLTVTELLNNATMKAAAVTLSQDIESSIAALFYRFPAYVGTPGTPLSGIASFNRIPQRMDEMAIPADARSAFLSPADGYGIVNNFAALYAQQEIAKDALTKAKLPMMGNVDAYIGQSVATLTTGSRATTGGTVTGAAQDVTYAAVKSTYVQTINVTLGANVTVAQGDVFTIAGVYAINPRTKAPLPYLQQFSVQAAATANGAGAVALTIANPIIVSGAFANCSASPANGAAIVFVGAPTTNFTQNMAFHEQAITLAGAKLTRPATGECDYATDPETGISIRYWKSSDITTDTHFRRWDILYGVRAVDTRLGVRAGG